MEEMRQTGIQWIGEIPTAWNTKRIKYMATLKGRIGWQGLTSEEYQDEGAYLITGVDFADGGIDWENCVHVPMKRWEEATDIQILLRLRYLQSHQGEKSYRFQDSCKTDRIEKIHFHHR